MRSWKAAAVLVVALWSMAGTAAAHPDDGLLDGTVDLQPGDVHTAETPIHFHRLVGRIRTDGQVTLRVVNAGTGTVAFETGVDGPLAVNHLVACCSGIPWSDFRVEISNDGTSPSTVDGRLSFVHDDLAVVVRQEEGSFETPLLLLAVGVGMVRAAGRRRDADTVHRRRRLATGLAGVAAATTVVFSLLGRIRYGGNGVEGLVASVADLIRFSTGSFFSGLAVLMGVVLVAWLAAGVVWSRGVPPGGPDLRWMALGAVFAGVPAVVAVMMARTYGTAEMPAVLAVSASVPVLVAMWRARRLVP